MKKLLFIAVLTLFLTASAPAAGQNGAVKPLFSPPTFSAPQPFNPPSLPYSRPGYEFGRQNRSGSARVWVTPDYDTHKRDLRDRKSWASPTPDPFANDPRNYLQRRPTPRGYIIQFD